MQTSIAVCMSETKLLIFLWDKWIEITSIFITKDDTLFKCQVLGESN